MATYIGMTYKQILEKAELIAQENGFNLSRAKSANFIDEALMNVGFDILEFIGFNSQTWPTGSPPSVVLGTSGWMQVDTLYGDSTPLVEIPYENYREMFLGDTSQKASGDFNYYWARLGDVIYLEPDVTEFTNLIIEYAPLFSTYEQDGSVDDNEPELQYPYRMLVSYKIPEIIYGGIFEAKYAKELRKMKSLKNKRAAIGKVQWWDPFAGTNSYRTGAGWPGKISND